MPDTVYWFKKRIGTDAGIGLELDWKTFRVEGQTFRMLFPIMYTIDGDGGFHPME